MLMRMVSEGISLRGDIQEGRAGMGKKSISVLIAGDEAGHCPKLLRWLRSRGCLCQFASSYRNACQLIVRTRFDLVISQYQLSDRSAFPLVDLLAGSGATLYFSTRVESGSLWLPMLERGERRIGTPLVKSNDLIGALDKVLSDALKSREVEASTLSVGLGSSCPKTAV